MKLINNFHRGQTLKSPPCANRHLQQVCSRHAQALVCCAQINHPKDQFYDRASWLWPQATLVDLFQIKEPLLASNSFRFKVISWSMYPVLKRGDILQVAPWVKDSLGIGDIAVYRQWGRLYAHRVVDKQVRENRVFIATRPDAGVEPEPGRNSAWIPQEEILGKAQQAKRGRRVVSTLKRKATAWEKAACKIQMIFNQEITLFNPAFSVILTKTQSLKLYQWLGRKVISGIKSNLNFELILPLSCAAGSIQKRFSLNQATKVTLSQLPQENIFHLILRFKNSSIGSLSIVNRPNSCAYPGLWLADVYVRFRYRGLGLEAILLNRVKEILPAVQMYEPELFGCPQQKTAAEAPRQRVDLQNNAEELLLICARKVVDERLKQKAGCLIQEGIDWDHFVNATLRGGVTVLVIGMLGAIGADKLVPKPILDKLKFAYFYITARVMPQHQTLTELLRLFEQAGIAVIPLKGTILSQRIFGDITARGLSTDFDLLVQEADKQQAMDLLRRAGFLFKGQEEIKPWQWSYTFTKAAAGIVELHWDITMMCRYPERINGLWAGIKPGQEGGVNFYELKEKELLLYLCAHLVNSARLGQIRYLCDIHELWRKYAGVIDHQSLARKARQWKMNGSVYLGLKLTKEFFGIDLPGPLMRQLQPGIIQQLLIKIFVNRRVFLRDCARKRIFNYLFSYIFLELIEARSPGDYLRVVKRVLFPPHQVLREGLYPGYFSRICRGSLKVIKGVLGKASY